MKSDALTVREKAALKELHGAGRQGRLSRNGNRLLARLYERGLVGYEAHTAEEARWTLTPKGTWHASRVA